MKQFMQSNRVSFIIMGLAGLLLLIFIFWLGTIVGYKKALFVYRFDANYSRQFGGPRSPFDMRIFNKRADGDMAPISHGAFGEIISVDLSNDNIVVKGPEEIEKIVIINDKTAIHQFREVSDTSSLIVGRNIVVIGTPDDDGRINASLIRILPDEQQTLMYRRR